MRVCTLSESLGCKISPPGSVTNTAVYTSANDNSRFASCGSDKQVFLWDVGTGRTIRRFDGHAQVCVKEIMFDNNNIT